VLKELNISYGGIL